MMFPVWHTGIRKKVDKMTTPRFCPGKRDGQDKKLYYRLPLRKREILA